MSYGREQHCDPSVSGWSILGLVNLVDHEYQWNCDAGNPRLFHDGARTDRRDLPDAMEIHGFGRESVMRSRFMPSLRH